MVKSEIEAVTEILLQEEISQAELDALALKDEQLRALKNLLPMLYTPRGNIIKLAGVRITGKNFNSVYERIQKLKMATHSRLVVNGEGWSLILTPEVSDGLRETGQVELLVLNGWNIDLM